MPFLLDDEILGCTQGDVRDAEAVGIVGCCGIGHGSEGGSPVEFGKTEGCHNLEVTAIGSLAAAVQTVVVSKVREPLHAEEAEVVAEFAFHTWVVW